MIFLNKGVEVVKQQHPQVAKIDITLDFSKSFYFRSE